MPHCHCVGLRLCAGILEDGSQAALLCLPAEAPPLQDPGMCAVGQTVPESSDLQSFRLLCEEAGLISSPPQPQPASVLRKFGWAPPPLALKQHLIEWESNTLRTCPLFPQFSCKANLPSLGCPRLPICLSRQSACVKGRGVENRNPNSVRINSNQVLLSVG